MADSVATAEPVNGLAVAATVTPPVPTRAVAEAVAGVSWPVTVAAAASVATAAALDPPCVLAIEAAALSTATPLAVPDGASVAITTPPGATSVATADADAWPAVVEIVADADDCMTALAVLGRADPEMVAAAVCPAEAVPVSTVCEVDAEAEALWFPVADAAGTVAEPETVVGAD